MTTEGIRGWLRWKVKPVKNGESKSITKKIKKELTSKTTWSVILSLVLFTLKYFGILESIPQEYELGIFTVTILNVLFKIVKTLIYKFLIK